MDQGDSAQVEGCRLAGSVCIDCARHIRPGPVCLTVKQFELARVIETHAYVVDTNSHGASEGCGSSQFVVGRWSVKFESLGSGVPLPLVTSVVCPLLVTSENCTEIGEPPPEAFTGVATILVPAGVSPGSVMSDRA